MEENQHLIKDIPEIRRILENLDRYHAIFCGFGASFSKSHIDLNPPDEDDGNNDYYEIHIMGTTELYLYGHDWVVKDLKLENDEEFENHYRIRQYTRGKKVLDIRFTDICLLHEVIE